MDSLKCSNIKLELEPNLATLIDDCKRHIFGFVNWTDIINLADTCKQLRASVCLVFERKIQNAKINVGHWKMDSFDRYGVWPRITYPDIYIRTGKMTLKFLRIFGHSIITFHIDFCMFNREQNKTVVRYLAEYGAGSFIELSLQKSQHYLFPEPFPAIPFTSVKILQFEFCQFDRELPIATLFPNVQTLKLGNNCFQYVSAIRMQVPSVKHLYFDSHIPFIQRKFETDDVLALLKLNPQLEKLDLQLHVSRVGPPCNDSYWDPTILQNLQNICPNLKRLKLVVPFELIYCNKSTPIHFDHIEDFSFIAGAEYIRFSFSKLKSLVLKSQHLNLMHSPVKELVEKNDLLTSIAIHSEYLSNVDSFFEFKNVLENIQEINIGLIDKKPFDLSWECVLRFLKQNRKLRKFSMIGTRKKFCDFAHRIIIAEKETLEIRNRAMHFMIERDHDGLSTKYAIRNLNWILTEGYYHDSNKVHQMQFCTFEELSLTTAQENDRHFVNASHDCKYASTHPEIEDVKGIYVCRTDSWVEEYYPHFGR